MWLLRVIWTVVDLLVWIVLDGGITWHDILNLLWIGVIELIRDHLGVLKHKHLLLVGIEIGLQSIQIGHHLLLLSHRLQMHLRVHLLLRLLQLLLHLQLLSLLGIRLVNHVRVILLVAHRSIVLNHFHHMRLLGRHLLLQTLWLCLVGTVVGVLAHWLRLVDVARLDYTGLGLSLDQVKACLHFTLHLIDLFVWLS